MEIRGSLWTVALMALLAAFLVEAWKRITKDRYEDYDRYIPMPLAVVCVAAGVALAALGAPGFEGLTLVEGGAAGFVAAALAAFGYDWIKGIVRQDPG